MGNAKGGPVGASSDGGELEVLVGGELGNDRGEEGDHPELAEEEEAEDGGDKDDGGEDTFHGPILRVNEAAQERVGSYGATLRRRPLRVASGDGTKGSVTRWKCGESRLTVAEVQEQNERNDDRGGGDRDDKDHSCA